MGLKNIRQQGYDKEISPSIISRNVGSIGTKSVVKKWRTVEQNLGEILRSLDGVVNVIDVAAQNVGYDIETIMTDGTHVLSFGYDIELEILKLMNCMNPIYFTGETYTNEQLAHIYLYYKDLIIGEMKWHIDL